MLGIQYRGGNSMIYQNSRDDDIDGQLFLITKKDVIVEISEDLINLVDYSREELINKNILQLFKILRVSPNIDNIDEQADYILFTKLLEVRFINIEVIKKEDEEIYVFREEENSRLEDKFPYVNGMISENIDGVAIYSASDGILLKASQKYLDFFDVPHNMPESTFGKSVDSFFPNWKYSKARELWRAAIEIGKLQYVKEYNIEIGERYWDIAVTPIKEKERIKYIVINRQEVTEKVWYREKLKNKTEEMKVRNKQLEAVFKCIPCDISIIDKNGKYLKKSSELRKILEPNIMSAWTLEAETDFFDLNGNPIPREELCVPKLMKGENIKNLRMRVVKGDKENFLEVNGTPIFDENNEFEMGIIFDMNITETINLSNKIKEQKELLEATIENMNDSISIYDKTGTVIYTNLEARKLYPHIKIGSKVEDFIKGMEFFDLENKTITLENLPTRRVFNGEKIRNERVIRKFSGKTMCIEVNAVPIFDHENNFMLGVVSHRDITKTLEYEEKLSDQNKLLKTIMNNIQENMVVFDKNGDVLFADKISKEIVHNVIYNTKHYYDSAKTYNVDGNEIQFEESHIFRIMRGEKISDEITYYECNGKRYYTMLYGKPIFDNKGDFQYGVYCRNNITEFMRNQQMLRETQEQLLKLEYEKNESLEKALEMKDDFLSLISHEFRTPLNVINSAIQTLNLIYGNDMTRKVKEYIGIIRQNTNRQLRLVNNLLDITRANAGRIKVNKKNIDLVFLTRAIIESVYDFSSKKGINITFKSSVLENIIAVDDEKYERIILNLLSNAIKFTPEGKNINVNIYPIEENVCINVEDNGIGIPQDKIDLIFDKFGQVDSSLSRQAEGSGIGLSLVKKFVEALGGSISVNSELGKGSVFKILLPNETITEKKEENPMIDFIDNRLVQTTKIEFSDIYL